MEIIIREDERNMLPPADWGAEIQKLQEELVNEHDRMICPDDIEEIENNLSL